MAQTSNGPGGTNTGTVKSGNGTVQPNNCNKGIKTGGKGGARFGNRVETPTQE